MWSLPFSFFFPHCFQQFSLSLYTSWFLDSFLPCHLFPSFLKCLFLVFSYMQLTQIERRHRVALNLFTLRSAGGQSVRNAHLFFKTDHLYEKIITQWTQIWTFQQVSMSTDFRLVSLHLLHWCWKQIGVAFVQQENIAICSFFIITLMFVDYRMKRYGCCELCYVKTGGKRICCTLHWSTSWWWTVFL